MTAKGLRAFRGGRCLCSASRFGLSGLQALMGPACPGQGSRGHTVISQMRGVWLWDGAWAPRGTRPRGPPPAHCGGESSERTH